MKKFLFVVLLFITKISLGQGVFAEVQLGDVVVNNPFQITYHFDRNISNFEAPKFGDNFIVNGPSQSKSFTSINGKSSFQLKYVYTLIPKKAGKYDIPQAKAIFTTGKSVVSNPLTIKVQPKSSIQKNESNDYFVEMEFSDENVSIGQKFIVNYVIYSKTGVTGMSIVHEDDYQYFKHSPIKFDRDRTIITRNGQRFFRTVLLAKEVYAQKSGEYEIEGFTLRAAIPLTNKPLDIFGNISTEEIFLAAKDVKINVQDLNGTAPPSYCGGIGKFLMKTTVKDTILTTDDAVTFNMIILGTGNPKFWTYPEVDVPSDWEQFEPKLIDEEQKMMNCGSTMKKTYEYVYLPKKAGKYTIEPKFSFFSSVTNKYETLESDPITFTIKQGKTIVDTISNTIKDQEIKLEDKFVEDRNSNSKNYPLAAGGLLLFLSGIYMIFRLLRSRNNDKKLTKDTTEEIVTKSTNILTSTSKTDSVVSKVSEFKPKSTKFDINSLERKINSESDKEVYKELSDQLKYFIANEYDIDAKGLSKFKIEQLLIENKVDRVLVNELIDILNNCELYVFGGLDGNARIMLERAKMVIKKIEG